MVRLLFTMWFIAAIAGVDLGWPTYGFRYDNSRHVDVRQIDASNVAQLVPAWRFVLGPHERVETTPIVVGNVMYVTTGLGNNVVALDATTGALKWRYVPKLGADAACCGPINRGVAVAGDRVFLATLDAQLIALDAANGRPVWHVRVADPARGFSETMAPLVWNGIVYIGSAGADFGIRGSLSAYRASDGKALWRWYAVSPQWEGRYAAAAHGIPLHRNLAAETRDAGRYRDAWMRGGGAIWMTPALDERRGILYASTANPAPIYNGAVRPGDNLYTDSIVAIDARTGKLQWYYQETPHDMWEYEAASPPILFEARAGAGRLTDAVGEAGKTGWFYIVNRRDGKPIRISEPLAKNSKVYDDPSGGPTRFGGLRGIVAPVAYDPARHLAFISAADSNAAHFIAAVSVDTGRIAWKNLLTGPRSGIFGGVMPGAVSAGDLVFVSSHEGIFQALNAGDGRVLWHYALGSSDDIDVNASGLQRVEHLFRDWLLPAKRWFMHQDAPPNAAAIVNVSPIVYEVGRREFVEIGYDAAPERAQGAAIVRAFTLPAR